MRFCFFVWLVFIFLTNIFNSLFLFLWIMCTQHPPSLEKNVGSLGNPRGSGRASGYCWEFLAMHFDHAHLPQILHNHPLCRHLSITLTLSFCMRFLFVFFHQVHFVLLNYSWEWGPPCCVIHLSGIMSLKKADCHSPRSDQIPIAPQVKMVFSIAMKSKLEQFLFESKVFLPNYNIITVRHNSTCS